VAGLFTGARAAGLNTVMTVRPGNLPQPPHDHRVVASLEEIQAERF
jgi:hypothetical protein